MGTQAHGHMGTRAGSWPLGKPHSLPTGHCPRAQNVVYTTRAYVRSRYVDVPRDRQTEQDGGRRRQAPRVDFWADVVFDRDIAMQA